MPKIARESAGLTFNSSEPHKILAVSDEPLLPLGERGAFDDNGMTPSCLVSFQARSFLYYFGWNPGVTVPYRIAIGCAVSDDDGRTFRRAAVGPLLDRDLHDPYFSSCPCVIHEDGRWRMWYMSCTGWVQVGGRPEPTYHIRYAESDDGIVWRRTRIVCIDYDDLTRAIARPWVIRLNDRFAMWFSYRGLVDYRTDKRASYRVGFAESFDGLHWERKADPHGLERSADGWDSTMVAYTNVVCVSGRLLCFYNGNGFGQSGFGYAMAVEHGSAAA